jgi:MSHA pilin protein MshA
MKTENKAFTMLELIMVIVIIGVLAAVAIPRFINMRLDAANAAAEANIAAMRSAAGIYYGQSATPLWSNLCVSCGAPCGNVFVAGASCNCARTTTVTTGSCFPATTQELELRLNGGAGLTWPSGATNVGACYDSATGVTGPCQ